MGVSSSFKGAARVLKRGLKDTSGKFKWCFKENQMVFQEYLKKVQREFKGSFKGVSRKIQRSLSLKEVSRVFH